MCSQAELSALCLDIMFLMLQLCKDDAFKVPYYTDFLDLFFPSQTLVEHIYPKNSQDLQKTNYLALCLKPPEKSSNTGLHWGGASW